MAKFEQTLKNSTLTFNTLPEHISNKVDDMDKIPKLGPRKYNLSSKSKKELSSLMSKIKKLLDKK